MGLVGMKTSRHPKEVITTSPDCPARTICAERCSCVLKTLIIHQLHHRDSQSDKAMRSRVCCTLPAYLTGIKKKKKRYRQSCERKAQIFSALSTIQSTFVLWFRETDSTQQEINYIKTNMDQRPLVICIFSPPFSPHAVPRWRTESGELSVCF